jgi:cephalosporin-C deacetylase-like acetyl esterase
MKKGKLLLIFWFSSMAAMAQKEYNVLPWKSEYSLNSYLVQQMKAQYAQRQIKLLHALTSKSLTTAYRDSCRKIYKQLIGDLPQKAPLNPQTVGIIKKEGYTIEKIIFESFTNHHLTANFYLPTGKGPFAAALFFCGHEAESKATESYQKTAALFARNGIAVLMIDPLGQGERHQLTDKAGSPLTRGGTTEHTLLNAGANLVGTSVVAYQLFDNIRSLDYLETRPEIDKEKIGCLGNSGGGTQVAYFMAYDERVKVAAPCSYISSRERTYELAGPSDGCVHFPYEKALEISDYLIMFAPKPALILAGRYDFVDYPGAEQAYAEAKKAYAALGAAQKIALFTVDDGHGISAPKREAAIKWFRQWLYGDKKIVKENTAPPEAEKALWCTPEGEVAKIYKDEISVQERNKAIAVASKEEREKIAAQKDKKTIEAKVRNLLALSVNKAPVEREWIGALAIKNVSIKKCIIRKEGEVPLPALCIYPAGAVKKVVLWLDERGKNKIADSSALVRSYLDQQFAVVMVDVRGMGETADKADLNDPKYSNREYRNTMLSLQIGKPLVGQQVQDVFTALDFIKGDSLLQNTMVEVHATGPAAVVALHAAFLDGRIAKLYLYRSIPSFFYLLDHPLLKDQYSYVVPGSLLYYDLPDLVRFLGTDKVVYSSE